MATIEKIYRSRKTFVEKYFGVLQGDVHEARERLRKIRKETPDDFEKIPDLQVKSF